MPRRRVIALAVFTALLFVSAVTADGALARLLPDGDVPPSIDAAALMPPAAHNRLLEADLEVVASDNLGVSHLEYRWVLESFGSIATAPIVTDVSNPTVSFATVRPETRYALEVRAIDVHGWESEWELAWRGTTPPPPHVIVAGDSVASGYRRAWFSQDSTCRDIDLSYGSTVVATVAAGLPPAWAPTYTNLAWPGAGVGDVLSGGSDSCSDRYPSQVDEIEQIADPATWNIVVMTAGINSTNWVDVITALTRDTALSLTERGDKAACQNAVAAKWNIRERSGFVSEVARDIATRIADSTNARLLWTSYYQLAGTRFAPLWSPVGPECEDEMNGALELLHGAVRAQLPDTVTWVDLTAAQVDTQRWAGWPHPDASGHAVIGRAIADSITG